MLERPLRTVGMALACALATAALALVTFVASDLALAAIGAPGPAEHAGHAETPGEGGARAVLVATGTGATGEPDRRCSRLHRDGAGQVERERPRCPRPDPISD